MNTREFLEKNNLINDKGDLNDQGWQLFSVLLDFVKPYPNLTPGRMPSPYEIFDKLMNKIVPASQELILIRDKKIYLTYRKDKWWNGWHVPGVNIKPRETIQETSQRIADSEVPGILITNAEIIGTMSIADNPRFHNVVFIVKTEFEGEPTGGEWFSEFPTDFLEVQQRYIPIITPYLQ